MINDAFTDRLENRLSLLFSKADAGNAPAQIELAERYLNGISVARDMKKATDWYQQAAVSRDATPRFEARFMLATIILANEKSRYPVVRKAVQFLEEVAASDHTKASAAKFNLGAMYCYGQGAPQNISKGVRYLLEAALDGQEERVGSVLGPLYANGDIVKKDAHRAAHWLMFPALAGNADAQCMLGILYAQEPVLGKRPSEAISWLNKSAGQGNEDAAHYLKRLRSELSRQLSAALHPTIMAIRENPGQCHHMMN